MTDVALVLSDQGADLALEDGDLKADEGLLTPILLSLFSDARAAPDEAIPEDSTPADEGPRFGRDPRGWWAERRGDRYGSKLWLLSRAKSVQDSANRAREYATEALEWLLEEGIAARIEVEAELVGPDLYLELRIVRGGSGRWAALWEATRETIVDLPGVRLKLLTA